MHQPRRLANHRSGVKLITLRAVSCRQPGDVYLWTHVSNLAITVPLINSLSASLPGDQGFRDIDGLMMLVSCNSMAIMLYSDRACVRNNNIGNDILLKWMIYMNQGSSQHFLRCLPRPPCLGGRRGSFQVRQRTALMFCSLILFSDQCQQHCLGENIVTSQRCTKELSARQRRLDSVTPAEKTHSAGVVLHFPTFSWSVPWTNLRHLGGLSLFGWQHRMQSCFPLCCSLHEFSQCAFSPR